MYYAELHNHLYGSLSPGTLFDIGKNNPSPRWEIFSNLYKELYGKEITLEEFKKSYNSPEKLKEIYLFKFKAPFMEFQCKFNLIIALSMFNEEEIIEVTKRTCREHYEQNIRYSEYRITYSPFATEVDYNKKTKALCEGLKVAEKENVGFEGRMIITFHRGGNFRDQYRWIKSLMKNDSLVAKYLVGIDFSSMEEGFPPKDKKDFFKEILEDNSKDNKNSLAIVYHVGESFNDKTPYSAIRWIIEASNYGVMRLGHAIALGEDVSKYEGKNRKEKKSERVDHLNFLINNYSELESIGKINELNNLKIELSEMQKSKLEYYEILMDSNYLKELEIFQKFGIYKIKQKECIIESCPTSNYLIGMIDKFENLPLKKFANENLKLTIGADDPGIFETKLIEEYKIAHSIGIPNEKLEEIRKNSFFYKSEFLSGRRSI